MKKSRTWFVSGCTRNLGHVALERSLSKTNEGTFEFFVADGFVSEFIELMDLLKKRGDLIDYCEAPNRFGEK
jgi:hypothetical protein